MKNLRLTTYRISESGTRKALGGLEAEIMELCWSFELVKVRDVHLALLSQERDIAYTTVMTVMSRLAAKGILKKERNGKCCLYTPVAGKDEFHRHVYTSVVNGIKADLGKNAYAFFIDNLLDGDGSLDEIQALINERRDRV